jgi:Stage II sporulation protein E (SpoIIE)
MRKLALLLLCMLPLAAFGQSLIHISPQRCVWRAGDNSAWAAPALDESGWRPYSDWQQSPPQPHIWIRCHPDLSSLQGSARPALQIRLYASYEVFVNGERIGSAGNLSNGRFNLNLIRNWPLPRIPAGPSTIALRSTWRIGSAVPFGPYLALNLIAGSLDNLQDHRSAQVVRQSARHLIPAICFSIVGILGLLVLALWFYDRSRREFLLLGINCVALAPIYINYMGIAGLVAYPVSVYFIAWAVPALTTNICRTVFFFELARRRVPRLFWLLIAASITVHFITVAVPLLPPAQSLWLDVLRSHQLGAFSQSASVVESTAPFFAFLPWRQLSNRMKPLAMLCMAWGVTMMVFFTVRLTSVHVPGLPDLQGRWSNVVSDFEAVSTLGVLIALLALLFRDQQATARERAMLAGELQAASEIQHMLAPAKIDTASGLKIDVAFHPMREVGGDFYSCRILPGNRQRVLLGDVSGKGAAAAMTAALLLGGAERRDGDSPGKLLAHLNGVLHQSCVPGFATCLCADFAPDGTVTLANAGHLPPYCRGEEIALAADLPLGMKNEGDGAYEEARYVLAPGGALTFLSDGVVEARDAKGELLGFDRMAALSAKTPAAIAEAAQRWGQEGDITVLSVTRTANMEEATA